MIRSFFIEYTSVVRLKKYDIGYLIEKRFSRATNDISLNAEKDNQHIQVNIYLFCQTQIIILCGSEPPNFTIYDLLLYLFITNMIYNTLW